MAVYSSESERGVLVQVISLRRRVDRRQRIEAHLATLGMTPTFVDAVDGAALQNAEQINEAVARTGMSPPEVGCYLSHLKAWRKLLESDEPYALVLEDDAICDQRLLSVLRDAPAWASTVHMVRLSALKKIVGLHVTDASCGVHLVLCRKSPSGLQGYVITRSGATHLLKEIATIHVPIDTEVDRYWQWCGMVLNSVPPLVFQDGTSPSDLAQFGRRGRNASKARLGSLWYSVVRRWGVYKTYLRCALRRNGVWPSTIKEGR